METEKNLYKIDLVQTIFANLINLVFMFFLLIIFAILSHQIMLLENDTNKLLGIIISVFVLVRLVSWCIIPQFCYMERKENKSITLRRKK